MSFCQFHQLKSSAIMSALISYMTFLKNSMITVYFYRIGYTLTYLFGVTGNTASLLTFSRPTLRKVSTGFLFMTLAISDLMFLFACLFDYIEFGWQVNFFPYLFQSFFLFDLGFILWTHRLQRIMSFSYICLKFDSIHFGVDFSHRFTGSMDSNTFSL